MRIWNPTSRGCSTSPPTPVTPPTACSLSSKGFTIQQGMCSVAENSVEFWTLTVEAGWNEPLLIGAFRWGLNRRLQDALALQGCPKSLDLFISLATVLDNYLGGQRHTASPTPIQKRTDAGPFVPCAQKSKLASARSSTGEQFPPAPLPPPSSSSWLTLPGTLFWDHESLLLSLLVDSVSHNPQLNWHSHGLEYGMSCSLPALGTASHPRQPHRSVQATGSVGSALTVPRLKGGL